MSAIDVRDVRKVYRRYSQRKRFATLKSAFLSRTVLQDLRPDESFEALSGVTFDVEAGRTFGIVGRNGSGKSTMLKLIAGIGKPTSGTVSVTGRVSALIELGAGFHPEISGRENVFINGLMLGLTRREISARFDEIVAFAELESFIDAPVKTYSSGMYMRLGFAVAIHVDPDILLVDEVLAVGDEAFAHKCLDKFAEFRRQRRTIVLVTHSLDLVERFCEEAIWLDHGIIRGQGDPRRVIDQYRLDVSRAENVALAAVAKGASAVGTTCAPRLTPQDSARSATPDPPPATEPSSDMSKAAEGRWGSREVEITAVELLGASAQPTHVFESGERMEVRLAVSAPTPTTDFVFGIGIFSADGTCCYGTNTHIEGGSGELLSGRAEARFVVESLDLVAGTYKLDVAVHRANGMPYDYHRLLYTLHVTSRLNDVGIFRPRHHWRFSGGIRLSGLE
ncbi:MAG: ABC transporter ATP-binding protein [Acidobacteria bacterium]|nr:ABC transporter ATP-binding protein [Acidobacteriota bacterium]